MACKAQCREHKKLLPRTWARQQRHATPWRAPRQRVLPALPLITPKQQYAPLWQALQLHGTADGSQCGGRLTQALAHFVDLFRRRVNHVHKAPRVAQELLRLSTP